MQLYKQLLKSATNTTCLSFIVELIPLKIHNDETVSWVATV